MTEPDADLVKMFPCICDPPFKDGSHFHDCPTQYREPVAELIRSRIEQAVAVHNAHVQRFLVEMYQTMVDPVEEFDGDIEMLCKLLLERAREDRESIATQAQAVAATAERAAQIIERGSPMSTEKQSRQYFVAAIRELANADVLREQAQAVAKARLAQAQNMYGNWNELVASCREWLLVEIAQITDNAMWESRAERMAVFVREVINAEGSRAGAVMGSSMRKGANEGE